MCGRTHNVGLKLVSGGVVTLRKWKIIGSFVVNSMCCGTWSNDFIVPLLKNSFIRRRLYGRFNRRTSYQLTKLCQLRFKIYLFQCTHCTCQTFSIGLPMLLSYLLP